MSNNPELHKALYDEGIAMRRKVILTSTGSAGGTDAARQVLGDAWVDAALAKVRIFDRAPRPTFI
jgi:hypothetical protein